MKYIGDVDTHMFPNVGNSVFYNEFNIGNMLPQHGSRDSYLKKPIDIEELEDQINLPDDSYSELMTIKEAKLSEKERQSLPDSAFGIPEEKKFPMHNKEHVILAIKFFNTAEDKYKKQLAKRIFERMKECNLSINIIGEKNKLRNYLPDTEFTEKECFDMFSSPTEAMMNEFFGESTTDKIPDLIEPIVKMLEGKGYQVKYASPGHANTRFDNDQNKDGVINSKFATTARIIFSRDYKFSTTPQQWEWKVMDNDVKALYVKDYTYNKKQGTPEEAFKKYQDFYLSTLKTWAEKLPKAGDDEDTGEVDTNFDN